MPYDQVYNIIHKMLEYIKSELLEDEEEYSMGELASNLEEKNMSMDWDFIDTEEDPDNV